MRKMMTVGLLALTLTACTTLGGLRALTRAEGGALFTNPDAGPALAVVVVLDGPTRVTASSGSCGAPVDGQTRCNIGAVPEGQAVRQVAAGTSVQLTVEGSLVDGSATWKRPDGSLGVSTLTGGAK